MVPISVPRWKTIVRWLLVSTLIVHFVADSLIPEEDVDEDVVETGSDSELRIVRLKPLEVAPGGAVVLTVGGLKENEPVTALFGRTVAEILHQRGDQVVVRAPDHAEGQRLKVRVVQGERRAKGRDVWVRETSERKVFRNVLGGLALFVLGLRTLARALRAYAGQTLRRTLTRLTKSTLRGATFGALAGAITQSTVSTAGVLAGMLQSKLLGTSGALAALIGAQVGSLAMALLLPLGTGRDSILLVILGVFLVVLAADKRSAALSKATLGIGLLFYGLYILGQGFQPLTSDPTLLPYFGMIRQGGVVGTVLAAGAGVLLAAVLQGPGPLFAVVLGLVQSTGILGLRESLAILAGSGLGTALGTAVVAWSFGAKARRLAVGHLIVGTVASIVMLAGVELWATLAEWIVPGDPDQLAYGKKVLLPNIGEHLAVAYAAAHVTVYAPLLFGVKRLSKRLKRSGNTPYPAPSRPRLDSLPATGRFEMILMGTADFLRACLDMLHTGDRAISTRCEKILAENKRHDEALVQTLGGERAKAIGIGRNELACAFALVSCRNDLAQLQRIIETVIEEDLRLGEIEFNAVEALHALLLDSVAALEKQVKRNDSDLEAARALEISINAREQEARLRLLGGLDATEGGARLMVLFGGLIASYEGLGNHLYQAHEALTPDSEADLY